MSFEMHAQADDTQHTDMSGMAGNGDATQQPSTQPTQWFDSLGDESLREAAKEYETPEALLKAHLDLKGNAPQVPEKPEDYELPVPEKADPQLVSWFREQAHKIGMSTEQARGFLEAYNALQQEHEQKHLQEQAQAEKSALDGLMREWGAAAKEHVAAAERAAVMLEKSIPGLRAWLEESRQGNSPWLIRAFAEMGRAVGEDGWIPGRPGEGSRDVERTIDGRPMLHFPSMEGKN